MSRSLTDIYGPLIDSYTRAQALEDGVLHDVTGPARDCGILLPTAIATYAWNSAVAWPDPETAHRYETGRAWTVVAHAMEALRRAVRDGLESMQEFTFTPTPDLDDDAPEVTLGIEIGPGDTGEPVFTITAVADR